MSTINPLTGEITEERNSITSQSTPKKTTISEKIKSLSRNRAERKLRVLEDNEILAIELENKRMRDELAGIKPQQQGTPESMFEWIKMFNELRGNIKTEVLNELEEDVGEQDTTATIAKTLLQAYTEGKLRQPIPQQPPQQNSPPVSDGTKKEVNMDIPNSQAVDEYKNKIRKGEITKEQAWADFQEQVPPAVARQVGYAGFLEEFEKIKAKPVTS